MNSSIESILARYENGNTTVTILNDGTKIREYFGSPEIVHPESIDVKITDYCDMGCPYCHESSTRRGEHGDLSTLMSVLDCLPAGVELAIGGGNPMSHPTLIGFLRNVKDKGFIANITINQGHINTYGHPLSYFIKNDLVKGVGISITNNNFKYIKPLLEITDNVVFHVIAGVNDFDVLDKLIELGNCKVLVLGYKNFGFGADYFSDEVTAGIQAWRQKLPGYIGNKCHLSFDNLAIDQLNVKRLFTDEGWQRFYMGDDFTYTMYIDAVKQEYGPTSRSSPDQRKSFNDCSLIEFFKDDKETKDSGEV